MICETNKIHVVVKDQTASQQEWAFVSVGQQNQPHDSVDAWPSGVGEETLSSKGSDSSFV